MTKASDENSGKGASQRNVRGKAGRGRKDANFEWGEVDDVTQGDMLLPAKKKKRVPKKFEKIESTLTVGGPEVDPYEIKPPVRKPVAASLEGDDLAIPSYGKMLDEEEDEFSVFLRNAEKAEEREKNRPKNETPKSGKSRKSGRCENDRPPQKMKADEKEETAPKSDRNRPPRGEGNKENERRNEPKRNFSDSNARTTERPLSEKRPASRPNPSESKRGPERGAGNPLAGFKEKIAEIRDYGLARMKQIGFSQAETENFLSGVSGIEKIVGLIDVLLHSSVVEKTPAKEASVQRREERRSEGREDSKKKSAPIAEERRDEIVPDIQAAPLKPATPRKPIATVEERTETRPERSKKDRPGREDRPKREDRSQPATRPERSPSLSATPSPNRENWTFDGVPLSDAMLMVLQEANYEKPTPIQAGTIPQILSGRDIMGQSQTGSGKTAAFMIPIIERIEGCEPGDDPVALVVVPTRELAVQIRDETVKLSHNRDIVTVACYGGKPIADQIKKMRGGVDIVVGTPGRILDLAKRQALSLSRLKWVVLDEADRMLDIGFRPDIERILKLTPKERQTLLFSATLADPVVRLAQRYMTDPETCDFSASDIAAETIEQFYVTVDRERKFEALVRLLQREDPQQAIVFCRTKRGVDKLGRGLEREFKNWSIAAIHGDLTQSSRDHIMRSFRAGQIKILVATDVVGRGIDVSGISHIINYDIPQFCDDYVHRVGRTGRMGREGVAYTLVTSQEGAELTRIEMRINRLLKRTELEGFEAFTRPDDLEKEEEASRTESSKRSRRP